MEPKAINPDTIVADLMSAWPQSIPIFLKHHMSCVGCSMSGFETITDAARIYGLFLPDFMDELQQAIGLKSP